MIYLSVYRLPETCCGLVPSEAPCVRCNRRSGLLVPYLCRNHCSCFVCGPHSCQEHCLCYPEPVAAPCPFHARWRGMGWRTPDRTYCWWICFQGECLGEQVSCYSPDHSQVQSSCRELLYSEAYHLVWPVLEQVFSCHLFSCF